MRLDSLVPATGQQLHFAHFRALWPWRNCPSMATTTMTRRQHRQRPGPGDVANAVGQGRTCACIRACPRDSKSFRPPSFCPPDDAIGVVRRSLISWAGEIVGVTPATSFRKTKQQFRPDSPSTKRADDEECPSPHRPSQVTKTRSGGRIVGVSKRQAGRIAAAAPAVLLDFAECRTTRLSTAHASSDCDASFAGMSLSRCVGVVRIQRRRRRLVPVDPLARTGDSDAAGGRGLPTGLDRVRRPGRRGR